MSIGGDRYLRRTGKEAGKLYFSRLLFHNEQVYNGSIMRPDALDGDGGAGGGDPRRRWVILAVVCACVLAIAFALHSVPPVLSLIMAEFNLSHAQGGLLMSFFALPGIIVSIPGGMLADRYS